MHNCILQEQNKNRNALPLIKEQLKINSYNFLRSSIDSKAGFTQHSVAEVPLGRQNPIICNRNTSHILTHGVRCAFRLFVSFLLQIDAFRLLEVKCSTHFDFINELKVKLWQTKMNSLLGDDHRRWWFACQSHAELELQWCMRWKIVGNKRQFVKSWEKWVARAMLCNSMPDKKKLVYGQVIKNRFE